MKKEITRTRNLLMEEFFADKVKRRFRRFVEGGNHGLEMQRTVAEFYRSLKGVKEVFENENPSCPDPDCLVHFNTGKIKEIEVKSFGGTRLSGLTVCNHPKLLNDRLTHVINYEFVDSKLRIKTVVDTELYRLAGVCDKGKYIGLIRSNRDNGKKVKARAFTDFYFSDPNKDLTLKDLMAEELMAKTEITYTLAKLLEYPKAQVVEILDKLYIAGGD